MILSRRDLLRTAGAAAALPVISSRGQAQSYPSRPIRVLVGFAAGSAGDIIARLTAERLAELLGQQLVIDNRPGAGSNLAIDALVNAPAGGYTLGLANVGNAIGATLSVRPGFDITRDIAPIAGIVRGTSVMEVNPSFPAKTVPDFVAYARAHPGTLNFASGGVGTVQHVAGELFKMMTGINIVHVPYRGTPAALTDLVSGRVHVIFDNLVSSIEHIRSGQLHAVAVTTAARSSALPTIPTIGESIPGFEASTWAGFAAPKGTSEETVMLLSRAINAVLADPKLRARFADMGSTVLAGSPSDFQILIAEETAKWAKVVAFSGAKSG